eukprot:TRINITY_DN13505_c0_g1_i1.p1 TRINITY_DN13505_c0_g1~~TRINITY_DN13505_c0_g1_i1.p1  ORF type:complete len:386 (+),score=98.91 TRINITY_DN13505_c0_g1_i1:58-1158(+)
MGDPLAALSTGAKANLETWLARGGDPVMGRGLALAGSLNGMPLKVAGDAPRAGSVPLVAALEPVVTASHERLLAAAEARRPGQLGGVRTEVVMAGELKLHVTEAAAQHTDPLAPRQRPAIVYFIHGGGMAWFTPASPLYRAWAARLARRGVTVVAPDFRSSLAAPYPAGLNDCIDGLAHILRDGGAPVTLMGDSGGAHLAIATLYTAGVRGIDLSRVRGCFAYAPYIAPPEVYASQDQTYPSLKANDGYVLNGELLTHFALAYTEEQDRGAAEAYPLRYTDAMIASFKAPLCVVVDEFDPLHSEGVAFARRAAQAGKLEMLQVLCGSPHVGALTEVLYTEGVAPSRWGARLADQVVAFARSTTSRL